MGGQEGGGGGGGAVLGEPFPSSSSARTVLLPIFITNHKFPILQL